MTLSRPMLWRLREDHARLCRGEIVLGLPAQESLRTDTVIQCHRQQLRRLGTAQRIVLVPLYKLERYELPKPAAAPKWWTELTAEQRQSPEWHRAKRHYDDCMDAFRYANAQARAQGYTYMDEEAELSTSARDWLNREYDFLGMKRP